MVHNLQKHKTDFLFVPLGGANEIGLNVNLYHYQGKWLMVDCGNGFADDIPGVKILLPDLKFIIQKRTSLLGLFVTHAHEDHMGGIPHLISELQCPIFTTRFPANLLKLKLLDYDLPYSPEIVIIEPDSKLSLKPFEIQTVSLTHSSPEMQGLVIKTEKGTVFHTGDWKFDPGPVIGPVSNKNLVQACAKEGFLALVCDSTNVFSPGRSASEEDLQKSLIDLIKNCPNLVLVTTFASNLARVASILIAAKASSRKVVLTGRSIDRMIKAANASGYVFDMDNIIDDQDIPRYPRNEILVIATGCQGEENAATRRIVDNSHPIKLKAHDTVIFSSKIIPGNEKLIGYIMNKLAIAEITVLTEKSHFVHTSGHPCQEDLREMYKMVNPKISIPVHGEPAHIYKHAEFAKSLGVRHAIKVENGSVVKLDAINPEILGNVHNGYMAVDGYVTMPISASILQTRKTLLNAGAIVITLLLDSKKHKLTHPPIFTSPGCLDEHIDKELIQELSSQVRRIVDGSRQLRQDLNKNIKKYIKKTILSRLGKSPLILVNTVNVI
jgi:ribonuclease J